MSNLQNAIIKNDLKYTYKLLETEIYKIINNEVKKVNRNTNYTKMYELVEFANNNFEPEKKDVVNSYYLSMQNTSNLEADINNMMEIYYLVKKW